MKTRLVFLALALVGLAGCQERHLPPPRTAANDFFQALSESRVQSAYDSTTFAFQAQTSFNSFRAVARELNLVGGSVSCNWSGEEKGDQEIKLKGEITNTSGKAIPAILHLVKERGAWRVLSLRDTDNPAHKEVDRFSLVGKGASFTRSDNLEVPSQPDLEKLLRESLMLFNDAIVRKNFGEFYTQVSSAWQKQLTVGQLKRSFQPFVDANVNLSELEKLSPVFEVTPEVDTQGVLSLKGYYDTYPLRTDFTLRYIYEFPFWKLFGLAIELSERTQGMPATPAPQPTPEGAPQPTPAAAEATPENTGTAGK